MHRFTHKRKPKNRVEKKKAREYGLFFVHRSQENLNQKLQVFLANQSDPSLGSDDIVFSGRGCIHINTYKTRKKSKKSLGLRGPGGGR